MSYILDALRKAERDRHVSRVPTLATAHGSADLLRRPHWVWAAVAGALALGGAITFTFLRTPPTRPDPVRTVIAPAPPAPALPVAPSTVSPPPADPVPPAPLERALGPRPLPPRESLPVWPSSAPPQDRGSRPPRPRRRSRRQAARVRAPVTPGLPAQPAAAAPVAAAAAPPAPRAVVEPAPRIAQTPTSSDPVAPATADPVPAAASPGGRRQGARDGARRGGARPDVAALAPHARRARLLGGSRGAARLHQREEVPRGADGGRRHHPRADHAGRSGPAAAGAADRAAARSSIRTPAPDVALTRSLSLWDSD